MDLTILEKINNNTDTLYVLIRTIVVYIFAVLSLRYVSTRFKLQTPFDYVFVVILGAVFGGALYGAASLAATLLSGILLILLHELFAKLAFRSKLFGRIVKGKPCMLINKHKFLTDEMRRNNITQEDLLEICRRQFNHENLADVPKAILERSGDINLIKPK